jgi:hypothetical protein
LRPPFLRDAARMRRFHDDGRELSGAGHSRRRALRMRGIVGEHEQQASDAAQARACQQTGTERHGDCTKSSAAPPARASENHQGGMTKYASSARPADQAK